MGDCFISDGGFDVNKYLQHQTALCQRSLWRMSTALNLTNVVDYSLSIGNQAQGVAALGIKKTKHQYVFTVARNLPIWNCRQKNPSSASGGRCTWIIISCWRTHRCVQSFGRGFEFHMQIIWNSSSGLEMIPVLIIGMVRISTTR